MNAALDVLTSAPLWNVLSDGLAVVDGDGHMLAVNEALAVLAGRDPDDLCGQSVSILVPPDRRKVHEDHMEGYLAGPRARSMFAGGRLELLRSDGSLVPVLISLSPVEVEGSAMVVASVRDDSERVSVERRLAASTRDRMLVEARERIARELHDTVIAELFASGVSLEAVIDSIPPGVARDRAGATVDTLDRVITALRNAITGFRSPSTRSLRRRLVDLIADMTPALDVEPVVDLDPGLDALASARVADNVVAVVGEALTNVVRHSAAHLASVRVVIDDSVLTVEVDDDGVGIDPDLPEMGGVANMARRAHDLGGSCSVGPLDDGGSRIRWSVPIDTDG